MADMYNTMGGGGDPVPVKSSKNKGVANCTDGSCGPTTRGRMSLSRFNPTKSRYNLPKGKKKVVPPPDTQPSNGMHMNMRDLGDEPGQPSKNSDRNAAERKPAEIKLAKSRNFFGRK